MPRFGFLKDDDGRKKGSKANDNPYAQQAPQNDPYAAPMTSLQKTQASMGLGPRSGQAGLPSGPGPNRGGSVPPPRTGGYANGGPSTYGNLPSPPSNDVSGPSGGKYSAGGYGASGGYGSNKYGDYNSPSSYDAPPLGRPPTYRTTADDDAGGYGGSSYGGAAGSRPSARRGGYGGMGGTGDEEDDPNRQALFGDLPKKLEQQQQQRGYDASNNDDNGGGSGGGGGYGGGSAVGGAGGAAADAYGESRELTAEELEDEDVKRMNGEVRQLRNETDQSLDRSLMIANQTLETARGTMARMYDQRDRLLNVEGNLDSAANHNKIAEHRAAELKHYNRSMFAVKVNNPFTSKQRAAVQAQSALDEHRAEREQREETRRLAYLSNRNAEQNFDKLDRAIDRSRRAPLGATKPGLSSKFALDDDEEEDIQKEHQIDKKIGMLGETVGALNLTARAMNEFATEDLEHISRIADKSDAVDDGVRANRYRLERIEKGRSCPFAAPTVLRQQSYARSMMRPSSRLLATAATRAGSGGSRSGRPAPMALLPPIPLYRRLLRAHRKFLPQDMRLLGDEYIKAEFRAHRSVDNPQHLIGFLTEWQLYAQKIEGDEWVGEKLDPVKVSKMNDQQIGQLYELMTAIRNHRNDDKDPGAE